MDSQALLAELPRLRRYARALLGDRAAADDLVQDTLERAWARAGQLRPGTALRPWLLSIMHNLRVDQIRRAAPEVAAFEDELAQLPTRPTQSDAIELADLAVQLGRLPEEQRAVLLLVALEEMSYAEVATTLGIPQGTVMSRLARGRERLRRLLDGENQPALRVVR